jgi:ribonuclease PH
MVRRADPAALRQRQRSPTFCQRTRSRIKVKEIQTAVGRHRVNDAAIVIENKIVCTLSGPKNPYPPRSQRLAERAKTCCCGIQDHQLGVIDYCSVQGCLRE